MYHFPSILFRPLPIHTSFLFDLVVIQYRTRVPNIFIQSMAQCGYYYLLVRSKRRPSEEFSAFGKEK